MLTVLGIAIVMLGVLLSIALHEIGHLVPAKRSGVKVTQYMVGFGPTVWSRRRGETEYGVKAIPLGGYIRMIGMFPPRADGTMRNSSTGMFSQLAEDARHASASEVQPGDEHRTFYRLPVWRKLVIMLGGPTMNLFLAIVILGVLFAGVGVRTGPATTEIATVSKCVIPAGASSRATCAPSDPPAPALAAGLVPGERILALDGVPVEKWDDVPARVRADTDGQLLVTVERDGVRRDVPVTLTSADLPSLQGDGSTVRANFLGVTPQRELQTFGAKETAGEIWGIAKQTASSLIRVPQRMVGVWDAAFGGGERDVEGPVGIVGVSRLGGEVAASKERTLGDKVGLMLIILGGLNLALFIFNLVPLLPLDGGHVAGALWEGARRQLARLFRRPDPGYVDVARMLPVAYTVAILLISMSALLVYADIVNPIRLNS